MVKERIDSLRFAPRKYPLQTVRVKNGHFQELSRTRRSPSEGAQPPIPAIPT